MDAREISLSDIVVRNRIRKDPGDLGGLCDSIEEVGLLHPVVLNPKRELVAGLRRIEAFKSLGRKKIPSVIVNNLTDAAKLLKAERDENDCRLDFAPMEAFAMGEALEALEAPRARDRQLEGAVKGGKARHGIKVVENNHKAENGRTRDIVGDAVGMSGQTYQKLKAVGTAVKADPETFGPIAEEMDRTRKITPAYDRVMEIRNGSKRTGKKKKPPVRFNDDAFLPLCEQLQGWIAQRFDKAGGAEARDECAKLVGQLQRRIEKWRSEKPI
jgi:ParB family chromosome partitioning protein